MIVLRKKTYSVYDETDNLKRMRDADILAEEKKKAPGFASTVLPKAAAGAAVGAAGLGLAGGALKAVSKSAAGARGAAFLKGGKTSAIGGAIAGAVLLGGKALKDRSKEKEANQFYNDRLEYAQKRAKRREKNDWKQNMTQREGYSY